MARSAFAPISETSLRHESDCKLTLQNLPPHVIDSFVFDEHVTQNYSITFVWGTQFGEATHYDKQIWGMFVLIAVGICLSIQSTFLDV